MARQLAVLCALLVLFAGFSFGQGLNTSANKDDWEEINFEFNSSVLTDGFPSLLRIAELLNQNPGYKVKVEGHTDVVGSVPFNDRLGQARADTVKAFLEKYGARPAQVTASSSGKRQPKVDNGTKEGRFMNRRAVLTVTDETGKVIGAGGANDVLKALQDLQKKQEDCCSQILHRLDKLDDILKALQDLKDDNARLRADMDALRQGMNRPAAPAAPAPPPGPPPISESRAAEIARTAAESALQMHTMPKFSLLGLNAGADGTGNLTFTGRGQYFNPFNNSIALQAQGEYLYFRDRKEGQIDFGIVNRWKDVQMGGFASFKAVSIKQYESTGVLGQAAFTLDYLFGQGKVGIFGTKSFLDNAVVNRNAMNQNILIETYLKVVDSAGGSGAVSLGKYGWLEGNIGYLRSAVGNSKPGGTARFVFPLNNRFAFTAEGGVNETMITSDTNGRATFGILFGNFMRPREYKAANHPVPVDIPRIRYEVLTRTRRTGNSPPVADAGPDQIGVQAGTITLDGSGSFDPDNDPITFQWTQIAGPTVTLSSPTAARTTFTAAQSQTYAFRLTVKDSLGAQGIARVTVTTAAPPVVRIIRFTASPLVINSGDVSTLNWLVENANSITITGVSGNLNPQTGTAQVRPTQTTTYTLTATNANSSDTAVVTVAVQQPNPQFLSCSASPVNILQGETSTLSWQSTNATSVNVSGVGNFSGSGTTVVTPQASTTYTLTATGAAGTTNATCSISVQVQTQATGNRPVIGSFTANPMEILVGDSSTLSWSVTGADTINVDNGVGSIQATGSKQVTPGSTTTYTISATNRFGTATASATVTVVPKVRIISFTVNPSTITTPGQPVTFSWQTENAEQVFIDHSIGFRPVNGSLTNAGPLTTTTYTLTAVGRGSQASATVTVAVNTGGGGGTGATPIARIGTGDIVTAFRDLVLNGTASTAPDNDVLTYSWKVLSGQATIDNPTSATPTIHLLSTDYGDFLVQLTVTNSKGLSSSASIHIILVQARPLF